jgi:hypothetical protein
MKTVLSALSAALLATVGCFPYTAEHPGPPPGKLWTPPRPAPLVTPDQVTPDNAHQKSQALEDEMEQARRELPAGDVAVEGAKK